MLPQFQKDGFFFLMILFSFIFVFGESSYYTALKPLELKLLGKISASLSIQAAFWEVSTNLCGCPLHISTSTTYHKLFRAHPRVLHKPASCREAGIHHPVFIVQFALKFTLHEHQLTDSPDFRTHWISSFISGNQCFINNECVHSLTAPKSRKKTKLNQKLERSDRKQWHRRKEELVVHQEGWQNVVK